LIGFAERLPFLGAQLFFEEPRANSSEEPCPDTYLVELTPKLEEGTNAPTRIKDPGYKGTAHSTPEYIMESVVSPSTYVVKGFPDNLMPKVFGQKLSAGALKKIVDYLSQVKAGAPPPKIS